MTPIKQCRRCDQRKPRESFNRDRTRADGLSPYCRACRLAWSREPEHAAQSRETAAAWRAANLDRAKANARASARRWYAEHPEQAKASRARRRQEKRVAVYADNAKRRAAKRGAPRGDRAAYCAYLEKVKTTPAMKCYWCGKRTRPATRHVDHIVPIARGGADDVANLCVACSCCNLKKHAKTPLQFSGQGELAFLPGKELR